MKNAVGIRYTVEADRGAKFQLNLQPFASLRDFHALRHAAGSRF